MKTKVNGHEVQVATGGIDDPALGGPDNPDVEAKPAVVLIHGAGMDSSVWFLQTRYLAHRGFRVFAVDLPGHGGSGGDALTAIEDMADWVTEFMVGGAGLDSASLVGHSMGSFIALEIARRAAPMVDSISLLGTAPSMPVHPELIDAATNDVGRAAALMTGWSHAKDNHLTPHPSPGLSMTGGAQALIERSKPGVLAIDLAACAAYRGADEAAAQVSAAATVIIGRSDKMTPAKGGRALAETLGANAVEIDGAGHMMMVEQSAAVRRALVEAIRT